MDLEGIEEAPTTADQEASALERLVEPLVRIERDRVGQLDPRQGGATALGQNGETAVRGVDVEPHAALATQRRDLREGIHGAAARGTGRGGDEQGLATRARVGVHRRLERVDAQAVAIVNGKHAHLIRPEAEDARRARDR